MSSPLLGAYAHLIEPLDRPRIVSVACQPPHTPVQGACPIPLIQEYFPGAQVDNVVITQGLNGEPLRFPLHLWYSPGALAANTPINQSIFRITSGAASKPWCGPVIVLKYNGSRRQGYTDAGSNDLPVLSSYVHITKLPDRPQIVSVACQPPHTPARGTCLIPSTQEYFPGAQGDVMTQGLNGEPLRFPLQNTAVSLHIQGYFPLPGIHLIV